MNPMRILALASLCGLASAGCNDTTSNNMLKNLSTAPPEGVTSELPVGVWGGNDIELNIRNDGAGLFSFDCGTGGTDAPIHLDENGHFDATGVYTNFPFDDPNNPDAANPQPFATIFHGDVVDNTISISVEYPPDGTSPSGAPMDGFSVQFGTVAQIQDCQN
jgi:hypothetical protein